MTVYNPLSRPVIKYVRLPVLGEAYSVSDPKGNDIEVQLIPIADPILKIPGRESKATVELIFVAEEIPPLGFKSYSVTKQDGNMISKPEDITEITSGDGVVGFGLDPQTGLLNRVIMNEQAIPISQEFLFYEGNVGNNEVPTNRSSGAYIFRPIPGKNATAVADKVDFSVYRGNILSEVHQVFDDWVSQIIRIYNKEKLIEFDWLVGPIPDK